MGNSSSSHHDTITLESLKTVKVIRQGKFSVHHVRSSANQKEYALKIFPKDAFGKSQYQREALMFNLTHPNVIQRIPIAKPAYAKFYPVLTEFSRYGDFYDLVQKEVLNSEVIIRTYFHHLIAGLEYVHSHGVAHLDLKLDNLLLGADFKLKIIDFDLAQLTTSKTLLSGGTKGYRAPEVLSETCTNLTAVDIYAVGVILYTMKAKEFPFTETVVQHERTKQKVKNLQYYSKFTKNNELFWEMKAIAKNDNNFFSAEFKELINGMLECSVEKRFTVEDIKKSKWFNGPVLESQGLKVEMERRLDNIIKNTN